MKRKQAEIEHNNQKMQNNELIMKKMVEKYKEREEEARKNLEELEIKYREKEAYYLAKIQELDNGR
jgi:hypothetical protein